MENKNPTRREFLGASATAITGLAIVPGASSAALQKSESAFPKRDNEGSNGVDLVSLTLSEAAGRIRRKQISPVELTQASLDRIAALNPKLGAFITVATDQALEQARAAEKEIQQGRYRGPLHGIPVGCKDTYYTQGIRTTAASAVLKDFIPDHDATIVRRLKDAGAVIIGKTNLPEFSFGGYTPGAHNPWDITRNTGGSSGGSGAAMAASLVLGATGGDTSGSVRNPAATCGVVGHKPTFGVVPRYGVVPISWTLDHLGPLAKTVEDSAILLKVMAGYDPNDPYSARVPVPDYPQLLKINMRGLRLGMPVAQAIEKFHPDTKQAFLQAAKVMEGLGAQVREIPMPKSLEVAGPAHTIIRIVEAATYHRQYLLTKADLYGSDDDDNGSEEISRVRTNVEGGSLLTGAQYLRAQQVRRVCIDDMLQLFDSIDALLTPSMPAPAGEQANPPISFRSEFNLLGFPAITVPCGFSVSPAGLPIGIQISAKPFEDARVLAIAQAYESATDWHKKRPNI